MVNPGDIFDGRYFIEAMLGTGGFASVYRATDRSLARVVALKVIREELVDDKFLRLFEREAKKLAQLRHFNIVQIFDVRTVQSRPYLVDQPIEWRTLRAILDDPSSESLSIQRSLSYVSQLLDGLAHAHAQSPPIIHLDVKPNNFIVDTDHRLTILDFGIAHVIGTTPPTGSAFSRLFGSVHYMSPEQLEGRPVDARSDIYSASVVLFELLTGHRPALRGNAAALVATLPPNRELRDIILRGLENNPADRFSHATEMKSAIDTLAAKLTRPTIQRTRITASASTSTRAERSTS